MKETKRSIAEWLKYWIADYLVCKNAVENMNVNARDVPVSSLPLALKLAFCWHDSPQGYDYWRAQYDLFISTTPWITGQDTNPDPQDKYPKPSVSKNDSFMEAKGYSIPEKKPSEKKIIGYKAPYDLLQGRIKKGDIFSKTSNYGLVMYTPSHMTSGIATEIVKTWEPVYQPDEVVITVGRPEVNVTISTSARIEAKGQLVGWGIIEQIQKEMTLKHFQIASWPVSYPEVVIGCSRFSRADINKIWETFCKLNPNRTYETNRG